ncbi:MAG: hypothetical protein FJX52_15985 [Alphaproteobacteria bacterium]|nr:hypothetical protein [Alphaproteobacteria bacterium]
MMLGMQYLKGAIDCHIHACPHINGRSVNVFEATRQAAAAGMRGIGLMDNFAGSSGYAALAMAELGDLSVDVWGGLIMQPSCGGIDVEAVRSALAYGYGPGTGARYISLPTHHTRYIAEREGRSPAYTETTFQVSDKGKIPDPVPEIMELCAKADAVFDCGHVSGREAVALCAEGRKRGVTRLRTHAGRYAKDDITAIAELGAYCEFSFFFITHACQIGLTHSDAEKHRTTASTIQDVAQRIRWATPERSIVSSDCGISVLPPPVEGLREFMLLLEAEGFSEAEIRRMNTVNPGALFRVVGGAEWRRAAE